MGGQKIVLKYMNYIGMKTPDDYKGSLQLHDPQRGWTIGVEAIKDNTVLAFCALEIVYFSNQALLFALESLSRTKTMESGLGIGLYEYQNRGPYVMIMKALPGKHATNESIDHALSVVRTMMADIVDSNPNNK